MSGPEVFVPADPRWTRPYCRVARPSGGADWYYWAEERGGGWQPLAGPPVFELRAVTRDSIEARRAASSEPGRLGGE